MAHGDGPCRLLGQQVESPCGGFAEGEREILRVVGNEVKLGLDWMDSGDQLYSTLELVINTLVLI